MAALAQEADLRALLNKVQVPADDPRLANLRKLQEERRIREAARQANRAPPLPGPPRTSAGYPTSGYREDSYFSTQRTQAQSESEREILEAEARYRAVLRSQQGESTAIEEALAKARAQRQQDDLTMKAFREKQQNPKLRRSATAPPERKPNKLVQAIGGLISGLDVKARPWEAPSDELLELRRAKEALLTKQTKDAEDVKALEALVGDVRLRGTKDADLAAILKAVVDRKTSAEEARKKLELLKAGGKLEEKKELSLAEQEKIALMEHEASRLTIIKLQLAQREEARKELAAMEEKLKTLGLAAKIVTEEDELDKLRVAAEDDYGYFHADDSMFGDPQPAAYGTAFGLPGLHRSQTMDGRSRNFDVPMFDQPASLEGLFEPTHARTQSYGLPGPSGHGGHFQQPQVDQFGRPIRRPVKLDPWIASYWDDKNKSHQHAEGPGADGEHHSRHVDPRLDRNDPYFDPRFARAHEQRRHEAEKKAQLDRAKLMELEKEKEEIRRKEKQIEQMELEERQLKHADNVEIQQRELRRRAAAKNAGVQQSEARRQAAAKEQLNRPEHDLRTREGIEARKRELVEQEHYLLTLQKAETDASRRAQRVQELQQVQNQLHHVDNLNKLLREEEERARLAKALHNNPDALIKGLDLQAFRDNPKLLDDPLLLEKALRLVNSNISRGVSPVPTSQGGSAPLRLAARTSEFSPTLLAEFSMVNHAQQQEYLRRIEDEALRRRFLQQAVAAAEEDLAHDLYERFHHLDYDLDLYMPGQQDPPIGARTPVPDILIDRVRSPPTNQDIGPHIVERFVDDVPLQTQQFASAAVASSDGQGKGKGKAKGKNSDTASPSPASGAAPALGPSDVPTSRATSPNFVLPSSPELVRTTAGHPSGAALETETLSDGGEAAAIKRELQEIAEAEARIQEEEAKAARPALEASELAAVQPDSDDTAKEGFFTAQDDLIPAATPQASALPLPPAPFIANSPPRGPVLSPNGVVVWSPREAVPMPDLGSNQEGPEGHDTFLATALASRGEDATAVAPAAPATGTDAWPKSAPASPRCAAKVASPRSGKGRAVASPKPAWGDAAAPVRASPRGSVVGTPKAAGIASPTAGSTRSRQGSLSPRVTASPGAAITEVHLPLVSSPAAASVRSASRTSTPKAAPVSRAATPKATPATPVDADLPEQAPGSAPIAPQPPADEILKSPSVRSVRSTEAPSNKAISRVTSPVRSGVASPAASVRSAAKSVASESQHQTTPRASPAVSAKAVSVTAGSMKAASIAADSPKVASVRSPSIYASSEKAASASASPANPAAHTPKALSPSNVRSPAASAKNGSTSGSRVATPAAPIGDAWGSPAPAPFIAASLKGASKTASPAGDAWGSPAAPVDTALASPRSKVATPAQDAWPSPKKVVSPAASIEGGAWSSTSPLKVSSPAPSAGRLPARVTSPAQAGAWGDAPAAASGSAWGSPRAASVRSAGQGKSGASPAASKASVKASSAAPGSPAFGLLVSPKPATEPNTDAWGSAEEDHQKTATKGSDPVVVSMAEEPLPQPQAPMTDQQHIGQMEEHHDEERPFDVYYAGEPLDPGFEVDMTDHMPTTIQEAYPKSGPEVTPEAIEEHMSRIAYNAGYDALYQFAVQDRGDHYWVQGYMVVLHEVEENPDAPTGADFAVPTPAQGSLKSPSKQAKVTEGSEAG